MQKINQDNIINKLKSKFETQKEISKQNKNKDICINLSLNQNLRISLNKSQQMNLEKLRKTSI